MIKGIFYILIGVAIWQGLTHFSRYVIKSTRPLPAGYKVLTTDEVRKRLRDRLGSKSKVIDNKLAPKSLEKK